MTKKLMVGKVAVGGGAPVSIQSMCNTKTDDVAATVAQIHALEDAGCEIIRVAVPDEDAAKAVDKIKEQIAIPLIADIHFNYKLALMCAERGIDALRINPGNIGGEEKVKAVADICRQKNIPIRIGVNGGSLEKELRAKYGGVTAEALVESAMGHVRLLNRFDFDDICISVKCSDVPLTMRAYTLLSQQTDYPLHLGVTEAGDDREGRVKSAVGIGALLCDGIGDTIRVSLTEAPEREIPVARTLAGYFAGRENHAPIPDVDESLYSPYEYRRRMSAETDGIGGNLPPVIASEIPGVVRSRLFEARVADIDSIPDGRVVLLSTDNLNGVAEQRAFFLKMIEKGKTNPVVIRRTYDEHDAEALQVKAAADLGPLLLDGFGDGIWIENRNGAVAQDEIDATSLAILQAARVRVSKAEYIACPSCGRTLYDIERTLSAIKARTSHLRGIRIGVMGCIVNGPGEMADADYGYVGSGPGRITLYKGREIMERNIPQERALDALVELIRRCGDWREPDTV